MIFQNLLPRHWHMLLILSGTINILGSIYMCFTHDEYCLISLVNIALFLIGMFYQIYCIAKNKNYLNAINLRICIDNFAFWISIILMRDIAQNFIYAYLIVSWIHIIAEFSVGPNEKTLNFIQTCLLLAIPAILLTSKIEINDIMFSVLCLITCLLTYFLFQSHKKIQQVEKEKVELKKIEKMLLKHNFGNMASIVWAFADCDLKDEFTQAVHRAIDNIGSIIETIHSNDSESIEESKSSFKLKGAIEKVIGSAMYKYGCEIVRNIDSNIMVNTNLCSFLSSVLVFINNACEAESSLVQVYVRDNCLYIIDNGCGFDTSKIRLGHTTKKNGHGFGLVHALEACKLLNLPIKIDSKIKNNNSESGTNICIDLTNIIKK